MIIKKLILSEAAHPLYPFAENKLHQLEAQRANFNLPVLTKTLIVGDITMLLKVSDIGIAKVIMWGGGLDEILLTNGREIWAYSYTKDTLNRRATFDHTAEIDQIYTDHAVVPLNLLAAKAGSVTRSAIEEFDDSMMLPNYTAGILRQGNSLKSVANGEVRDYVGLPAGLVWDELACIQRNVGVAGHYAETWNRLNGPELWTCNPNEPTSLTPTWAWTPRIWYPSPGNALMLAAGLYYGYALDQMLTPFGSTSDIRCTFGGFLHDRGGGDVGYIELLTFYNDKDLLEGYLIDSLWQAGAESYFQATLAGGFQRRFGQNDYWASAPRATKIDYSEHFAVGASLTFDWVSCSDDQFLQCLVAHDGSTYVIHRRAGANAEISFMRVVLKGTGYKAHSFSLDGRLLAVFTGEDFIDKVTVYNLEKDELIIESTKVGGKEFQDGIFIPRAFGSDKAHEDEVEKILTFNRIEQAPQIAASDSKETRACAAGLNFPFPATEGFNMSGWKVVVEDGIHARGFLWGDPCWEKATFSRVTWGENDTPPSMDSIEHLIYYVSGDINEYATATFGEDGLPQADIEGNIYGRVDTFTFGPTIPAGELEASKNAKPPIVYTGDVGPGPFGGTVIVPQGEDVCAGFATVTATDACGLTVTQEFDTESANPLTVVPSAGYDGVMGVGDLFVASGGVGPYSFDTTGGLTLDVDDVNGIAEITAIDACGTPGTLRIYSVTVTDLCGATSTAVVGRLSGGHWEEGPDIPSCRPNVDSGAPRSDCISVGAGGAGVKYFWTTSICYIGCSSCATVLNNNCGAIIGANPCTGDCLHTACTGCQQSGDTRTIWYIYKTRNVTWVC